MCPFLRHNYYMHLLSEGQVECIVYHSSIDLSLRMTINTFHTIENDEPTSYSEAVMSSDSNKWLNTMKSKMDSMYVNQVWTLIDASEGVTPIGCKWVFKKKIRVDGQVETFMARLVAKGFRQQQGVDYEKIFSSAPMLKYI